MTKIVLTYEDFVALPDDGKRYELHEGELSVTPAPSPRHQAVLLNLALILAPHVRATGRGDLLVSPLDCIMSDFTVVEPDLLYVEESQRRLISGRGFEGAPSLAIEILSPSTTRVDRRIKMELYARHGVEHYWIVDPDARSIEAYHLIGQTYHLDATLEGDRSRALPPFLDLPLTPSDVWR